MSSRIDFEYLTRLSYQLGTTGFTFDEIDWAHDGFRLSDDDAAPPRPPRDETAQNDLGFFMRLAGRYPLLDAREERRIGLELWKERSRILRILRRARRSSGRSAISLDPLLGDRPVTASSRRRLARVEKIGREIAETRDGVSRPDRRRFPASGLKSARGRLKRSIEVLDGGRRVLVERNLRLVIWVAKRFRGRGFDFIDLIQEGSLGLMRAVDRFDPRVGTRFSTFATHWIQQGIRRALAEKARTIRIPVNRIPEARQILVVRGQLGSRLGRPARPDEIATVMGVATSKVEELLPAIGAIESIDAPIPSTDKLLGDTLEDRSRRTPLEEAIGEETRSAVKAVLDELPQRQRIILEMRHGIDYPRECTLDEIGDALGLSRERIRQVEKVAVAAVRDWIQKHRRELAGPVGS